jgi:uncharacterized protein involved in outer membrane biogenesis
MKRSLKWLAILVALVGVALVGLTLFLDRGIKRAVELVGPRLTQVDVRLDRVDLSLISGRVELEGLFIGNPEGYKSESAIEIGSLVLATRPSSLFSDKLVIRTLDLKAPVITFEGGLQDNNLRKILENVNDQIEDESSSKRTDRKKTESDKPSRKLQVDELSVAGGKVQVRMKVLGNRASTIDLPEIRMTNLGAGPEGITTEELTDRLLRVILEKATVVAATAMAGSPEGLADGLKRAGQEAVNQALDEAARGVSDLLKRRD